MKSRVKGDFQARFRENAGVKFPCVTRLGVIGQITEYFRFELWGYLKRDLIRIKIFSLQVFRLGIVESTLSQYV